MQTSHQIPLQAPQFASAGDVLAQLGISAPPVDVLAIAAAYGIQVYSVSGSQWDGAIEMGPPTVIYVKQSPNISRQRFTIAHEIGHYVLHGHLQRAFRDEFSAQGFNVHEIEANRFAADLLMPAHWVRAYARYENTSELAERFQVSHQAMRIRVSGLGLV